MDILLNGIPVKHCLCQKNLTKYHRVCFRGLNAGSVFALTDSI